MDRSKTPTPAAIQQQALLHKEQHQDSPSPAAVHSKEGSEQDRTATTATSSTDPAAPSSPIQQATAAPSSFFGWARSAIGSINPLNVVLAGTDSPVRSSTPDRNARHAQHGRKRSLSKQDLLAEQSKSGNGADAQLRNLPEEDGNEDEQDEFSRAKQLARASRRRRTSVSVASSVATDVSGSEVEDSDTEEIFTPFHHANSTPAAPIRTHSPVSPSNALKRLPFANHMRRSSSPMANLPGGPSGAGFAQASGGQSQSANADAGNAPAPGGGGGGGPRLFKPFARREALVLDESTPIDELDLSPPRNFASPSRSQSASYTTDASPSQTSTSQRQGLPALVLTPPDVLARLQAQGDADGTDTLDSLLARQQLSADASFEIESLEKLRIDMDTPDITNQQREMVAFGQAVADERATPKPFSSHQQQQAQTASVDRSAPAEPRSSVTPKPFQQHSSSNGAAATPASPPTSSRTRNIFRRSTGNKVLDFASLPTLETTSPRKPKREARAASASVGGHLSPTLLAEVDESVEELGTPSTSGIGPAAESLGASGEALYAQSRAPSKDKLSRSNSTGSQGRHAQASSGGDTATDVPQQSHLAARLEKVTRSASTSGSFWKFRRGGKDSKKARPSTSGSVGGDEGLSANRAGSRSSSVDFAGPSTPSSAIRFPSGLSSRASSIASGEAPWNQTSSSANASSASFASPSAPAPADLVERRSSILSQSSGGAGGLGATAGASASRVRISIDESHPPPKRSSTVGTDSAIQDDDSGNEKKDSGGEAEQLPEPVHRRARSMESFRPALGRVKSSSRKSNVSIGGRSVAARPSSIASATSFCTDRPAVSVKNAGKLSVKLWPKAVKTRYRGKSSNQRDFQRLVLAQELYLGWDPVGSKDPERRLSTNPAMTESRPSLISAASSSSQVQSPGSYHSGTDPFQSAGAALQGNVNHSGSLSSMSSSASASTSPSTSASTAALSASSASSSVSGAPASATASRSRSVLGGMTGGSGNGASSSGSRPRKSTWAMRFSIDGRYFAVAGQDMVIRVYEVLGAPEQRQAEVDAALLATGHGLGTGGSATSLGSNLNDSVHNGFASEGVSGGGKTSDGPQNGSLNSNSSRAARKAAKAMANSTNRAIPVFASRPIQEFRGHTADIIDLSWSKNNFLMSASTDKTARLWHVTRSECLCTFGHMDFVTGACFHPTDDRFFLSASLDGKLRLWNIPAKKVQYSQEVPGLITACAFTASGKLACAGTFGGAIVLYHTDKLAYATSIAVRSTSSKSTKGSKITGIEPVPNLGSNNERILVSSNDSRIRIYDLGDKSVVQKFKASGYHNKASQIRASISTDGMYIAAGSEDASVYVWEANQGKAHGGLRGAGNKVSRNATKQFAEAANEYWHTTGGTVTCAVVAPLLTHRYLDASEDPIMRRSWRHESDVTRNSPGRPLSNLTLSSAISAAMPIAFRAGPVRQQVNARLNRIVVTADDTSCVQVWRADSFDLLETIKQPMTVMGTPGGPSPAVPSPSEEQSH